MSENSPNGRLKLDPWVASSLLQKSIRRGNDSLAQYAVSELRRHRGAAVWRRLLTIAIEDVGIADVALVGEVTRLATDRMLRSILGSDIEIMDELCAKLAAAPKDRSTDYLYSAATAAVGDGSRSASPLIREASSALSLCTTGSDLLQLKEGPVRRFLASYGNDVPDEFEDVVIYLTRRGGHPFVLMLLPLWSAFSNGSCEATTSTEALPETEFMEGIPLWCWDKHTAAGKVAISRFARENPKVSRILSAWVPQTIHVDVTLMAAFYADAVPVARRFEWQHSQSLFKAGFEADMVETGCPRDCIVPVLECVKSELGHLNELRQAVLMGSRAKK